MSNEIGNRRSVINQDRPFMNQIRTYHPAYRCGCIHRRRTAIYLPAMASSLFSIAVRDLNDVIYIIIAKHMKTHHNSSTIRNISDTSRHNRLALALAGIMIAFICSLVLFHHHDSAHAFVQLPRLVETSKIASADIIADVKNIDVVSAMRAVKW